MRRYARMGRAGRAKKRDANEAEIISALEAAGASVVPLDKPVDLLVGISGVDLLLEVKNPDGKNQITDEQRGFIDEWRGRRPVVVSSVQEALLAIGVSRTGRMKPP